MNFDLFRLYPIHKIAPDLLYCGSKTAIVFVASPFRAVDVVSVAPVGAGILEHAPLVQDECT